MSLLDNRYEDLSNLTVLMSGSNPMMSTTNQPSDKISNHVDHNNGDSTDGLFSQEKLDRSSPDLWPEQSKHPIPGVTEFVSQNTSPLGINNDRLGDFDGAENDDAVKEWNAEFDQEDMNMMQGFSSLTTSNLLEKVRELQDLAYQLGVEESREMTRGRFLDVLSRQRIEEPSSGGHLLTPLSSPLSSIRRDLR